MSNCLILIVTVTASGQGALNFALLISRYIRQFLRVDPRVALQYVYSVCLSADQEGVGREQVEIAWELCRRVIFMAQAGGGWLADLWQMELDSYAIILPLSSAYSTHW